MTIVLLRQYYDLDADLADQYLMIERGKIIQRGNVGAIAADGVRRMMSICAARLSVSVVLSPGLTPGVLRVDREHLG